MRLQWWILAGTATLCVSRAAVANSDAEACQANEPCDAAEASAVDEAPVLSSVLLAVSRKLTKLGGVAFQEPTFSEITPRNMSLFGGDQPPGAASGVIITARPIACDTPVFAPSGTCPSSCPFFAEESGAGSCIFRCVTAAGCGTVDPRARIADVAEGVCRSCRVEGCQVCMPPGDVDKCQECASGYILVGNGECSSIYDMIWSGIFICVGVASVIIGTWYTQKLCQGVTNEEGLKEGQLYRSSLKLHMPHEDTGGKKRFWPLTTNMHVEKIAGAGFTLFWNFELASIMWASIIVALWVGFAYWTDPQQLFIGLLPSHTSVQLCSVTTMGHELQRRDMEAKVVFLIIAYVVSFIFFLAYSVLQRRTYAKMSEGGSMMDFAILCKGLPVEKGTEKAEEKLQQLLQEASGEQVVGVSICWDYNSVADDVQAALDHELLLLEPQTRVQLQDKRPLWRKAFDQVDKIFGFMGPQAEDGSEQDEELTEEQITTMLKSMATTHCAFVVFTTESSRDAALEAIKQQGGLTIDDHKIDLRRAGAEPDTVNWQNFAVTYWMKARSIVIGFGRILFALTVWSLCFYLPYAYFAAMSSSEEPGPITMFMFSLIVVGGNELMYKVCYTVSCTVGFCFNDHREGFYTLLYTAACILNVSFDLAIECHLGYQMLVAQNAHTADGDLLENLSLTKLFAAYPMQKGLGERLFKYNFPNTFLLPFVLEAILSIYLPYHLGELLLRTHPEVRGRDAEKSLDIQAPMDLTRYSHILLNMMLVVLVFFFPSGLTLKMFGTYIICHIGVYIYDQYRVLRTVPKFDFSLDTVELYAQAIMIIPPAIIMNCILFKANCLEGNYCLEGWPLISLCLIGGSCHVLLHLFCIFVVVPRIAQFHHLEDHTKCTKAFEDASRRIPCSWFSANPVHCLRSKYIYKHDPPCCYYVQGKEHLMEANEDIGAYYVDHSRTEDEYYSFPGTPRLRQSLSWFLK